ncbi:c-type heme family protein [Maribellus mangrovi]|uniref:c-type heme family protein n=1 Tax=Maribellus mangrovi TaxID=3133146 RepID=UPI0030EDEF62
MRKILTITVLVVFILFSCKTGIDPETYQEYQSKGNEVTNLAQATLLSNVGSAIQKGGPEYAVEFCNLKVSGIVDSLNQVNNCKISRISEKNRNPGNALKTKADKKLWELFEMSAQTDTVIQDNNAILYYKRINTAMPACLKCHGNPDADINSSTKEKLQRLYPKDLATGYDLNEFRGLWKVEFNMQ